MANLEIEKPWLKHYPAGVPAEIDLSRFDSLAAMIEASCRRYSYRAAFSNMGHSISFSEVERLSRNLAAYFQSELGLQKGDRIVIQMPNLLQYPVALFAALRAGLIVINTNPLYTRDEMERNFRDSGATAIILLENFADKLESILPRTSLRHVILTGVGDIFPLPKRLATNFSVRYVKKMVPPSNIQGVIRFRHALEMGSRQEFRPQALGLDDIACLQYTGGTTGVSKAAMLTHRNFLANVMQNAEWNKAILVEGKERIIAALPLYHVFCLTVNCLCFFYQGAENILITNPRDIAGLLRTIAQTRPTGMMTVSTLTAAILDSPDFSKIDLSGLKVTVAGGMALSGRVAKEWKERTKTPIYEGYGLTEASPVITCNPGDGTDRPGTIGLPLPSTDVRILDPEGKTVPQGEPGELCARGPQIMKGYWNQPEETRMVLDSEGWLHTGDIAIMDADGFFRIVDRKKDMILVSGFNVYPNEIEELLMRYPKVLEVGAIGVPDERSGEAVKVVVVKKDGTLTAEEIIRYCREHLAAYKCPRDVEFRAELPKTSVGKILRRELRESRS